LSAEFEASTSFFNASPVSFQSQDSSDRREAERFEQSSADPEQETYFYRNKIWKSLSILIYF